MWNFQPHNAIHAYWSHYSLNDLDLPLLAPYIPPSDDHIHLSWHICALYGIISSLKTQIAFCGTYSSYTTQSLLRHNRLLQQIFSSHGTHSLPWHISVFSDTYSPLTVQITFNDTYSPCIKQASYNTNLIFTSHIRLSRPKSPSTTYFRFLQQTNLPPMAHIHLPRHKSASYEKYILRRHLPFTAHLCPKNGIKQIKSSTALIMTKDDPTMECTFEYCQW